ncbi:MAG: hypothetical protein WCK77_25060 [Verrucomicrobiota bacterium]
MSWCIASGDRDVKVVHVVPVVACLVIEEIPQGVAHGGGGVGGKIAFGGIERAGSTGECLLGGDFDLGVRQARDVGELPGDFCREGKEFVCPCLHDASNLSGSSGARQAQRWESFWRALE